MHISIQELLVIAFIFIGVAVQIAAAVWVYTDAVKRKNEHSVLWLLGTLFIFPIVFIVYLILRPDFRSKEQEAPNP